MVMWWLATFTALTVKKTDPKTLFWMVKIKWHNAKHFLSLLNWWKTWVGNQLSIVFPFLTSVTLFSYFFVFFQPKIVHMYSFTVSLFIHTIQNNAICQVPISPIESQTFSLLKYKALYVDETPDHLAWTNSKTIIKCTKELPE